MSELLGQVKLKQLLHDFPLWAGTEGHVEQAEEVLFKFWVGQRVLMEKMNLVLLAVVLYTGQQRVATRIACISPPNTVFFILQINIKLAVLVSRGRLWEAVGVLILSNMWEISECFNLVVKAREHGLSLAGKK